METHVFGRGSLYQDAAANEKRNMYFHTYSASYVSSTLTTPSGAKLQVHVKRTLSITMAAPVVPQIQNPPTDPAWNSADITKPRNERRHTAYNVPMPNPQSCPLWRAKYGPFWGSIKLVANSGIQIRYGGPNNGSRQPPNLPRRGIGIKWRGQRDTWNGLLNDEIPIHGLEFRISQFGVQTEARGTLKIPVMGMPPREPTQDMIRRIRNGQPFLQTNWFQYATVVKASTYFHSGCLRQANNTVTITISPAYEFEVAEAEQDPEKSMNLGNYFYNNLYFIQLMPNELPSYVIYLNTTQQAIVDRGIRTGVYRGLIARGNNTVVALQLGRDGNLPAHQRSAFRAMEMRTRTQTLRSRSGKNAAPPSSRTSKPKSPLSTQAQTKIAALWIREAKSNVSADEAGKSNAKPKRKPKEPKNKSKVTKSKGKSRSKKK